MNCPTPITTQEFLAKLTHLKEVISRFSSKAIYLESEGAMRWLTGTRHQVIDIHPSSTTTISVIVKVEGDSYSLNFFSEPWEQNRLKDLLALSIFHIEEVSTTRNTLDKLSLDDTIIHPQRNDYHEIEREIVSPLCEGLGGNQYKKLEYLIGHSREALVEIAHKVEAGMNGWDIRSIVYETYHKKHIELNQVVLGLEGMEKYQHPIVQDDSIVNKRNIIKIVTGSRYIDMFHSATQLVKIDSSITNHEMSIYNALQHMCMEYASQFTSHKTEKELYASLLPIGQKIEREHGIPHFARSAHIHHAGGPISPLGNRDFVISKNGKRTLFPYTQFSINPVDSILSLKCELQGIVIPNELPIIIDEFGHITNKNDYMMVQYKGKTLRLPTIITNKEEC